MTWQVSHTFALQATWPSIGGPVPAFYALYDVRGVYESSLQKITLVQQICRLPYYQRSSVAAWLIIDTSYIYPRRVQP